MLNISLAINLTMNLHTSIDLPSRRVSQRRINKLLRSSNEFHVKNPFKSEEFSFLPCELYRQVQAFQFLSASSISSLSLHREIVQDPDEEYMLTKMNQALRLQQYRYRQLIGNTSTEQSLHDESIEDLEELNERFNGMDDNLIDAQDELPRNVFELCHPREEEFILISDAIVIPSENTKNSTANEQLMQNTVLQEEYENYFAN